MGHLDNIDPLALLLLDPCASLAADRPWVEAKSRHFVVVSYALLADVRIQLGRPEGALGVALRAASMEPAQMRHRLTVAIALWRLSRPQEAEQEARRAFGLAPGEPERQAAQQVIDFLARKVAPPVISKRD